MTEENKAPAPISLADWDGGLGSCGLDWLVGAANQLHNSVGLQSRQTAVNVWCAGRVLRREKELVGHGNWIDHCKRCHPEISQDTIERYVRVGAIPVDQLPDILNKTPRQVYLMLGMVKKKPSLPSSPSGQGKGKANSAYVRNVVVNTWTESRLSCPICHEVFRVASKGGFLIASRL